MAASGQKISNQKKKEAARQAAGKPNAEEAGAAKAFGLCYVNCGDSGIERRRVGKSFRYWRAKGGPVKDPAVLARIRSLVIPPAWENVWICEKANGHLQATGRDQRGRKQYRYHPDWSKGRNQDKFGRMEEFGQVLPPLRMRVQKDLSGSGMEKPRVLAAVVQLMERTGMRIGNEEYAKENDSYGATTMKNRHARVKGEKIEFHFRGKSGVQHDLLFRDRRVARIVRNCQHLPGQKLFEYVAADGEVRELSSDDVNHYLQEATGEGITAKDIRTWVGSVHAVEALREMGKRPGELTKKAAKERDCAVIKAAASFLGNTVAVCRKYYVHPAVFQADEEGYLHRLRAAKKRGGDLTPGEVMLLAVLKKYRNVQPASPKKAGKAV